MVQSRTEDQRTYTTKYFDNHIEKIYFSVEKESHEVGAEIKGFKTLKFAAYFFFRSKSFVQREFILSIEMNNYDGSV